MVIYTSNKTMKKTLFILSIIIVLSIILFSCKPNNIDSDDTSILHETDTMVSETETERVYFKIDENGDTIFNSGNIETYIKCPGYDRHAIRDILMEVCGNFVCPTADIMYDHDSSKEWEYSTIWYREVYNNFHTISSYRLTVRDGYITEISDGYLPIVNLSPTPVVTPQMFEEAYKMLEEIVAGYGSGYVACSEEFAIKAKYDIINDKYYLYATVPYTGKWAGNPDHVHGLAAVNYYLN